MYSIFNSSRAAQSDLNEMGKIIDGIFKKKPPTYVLQVLPIQNVQPRFQDSFHVREIAQKQTGIKDKQEQCNKIGEDIDDLLYHLEDYLKHVQHPLYYKEIELYNKQLKDYAIKSATYDLTYNLDELNALLNQGFSIKQELIKIRDADLNFRKFQLESFARLNVKRNQFKEKLTIFLEFANARESAIQQENPTLCEKINMLIDKITIIDSNLEKANFYRISSETDIDIKCTLYNIPEFFKQTEIILTGLESEIRDSLKCSNNTQTRYVT